MQFEVRRIAIAAFFCFLLVISPGRATAAQLEEAEVSQVIKDVQLLPVQAAPRQAVLKDAVKKGAAVRTGTESRAELTFTDQTIARMGANTIFSFNEGTRELNLGSGVMLVHVPKGAGGAKIVTAGVTAGITGTTLMFEYHRDAISKLIVAEGLVHAWLNAYPGKSVAVHGGQMLVIPPHATELSEPVDVDLEKLMLTSLLFTDFRPLPSLPLIEEVIQQQQAMVLTTNKDPTGLDIISLAIQPFILPNALPGPVFTLVTYLGLPAGLWSQVASWTPAVVPNNGGGKTYSAIIPSGMITQDIVAGVTIQQLQMQGGTLQLNNPLTLNTGLQFTGGSIIGGNLSMAGTSTQSTGMGVQNTNLRNSGTYDITFDSANAFTGSPATSTFNNLGTLRKTNGIDQITFNMPITNSGTISILSGAFLFDSGGTNSGTFSAAASSVIAIASNFSMLNGTRFAGPGAVSFADGTNTTLAGTITNNTTLFLNSAVAFTDFTLNGDVTFTGGGTINFTTNDRILGSGTLTNVNNLIQGETKNLGSIGFGQIGIINQAAGVIDANASGFALDVEPSAAGLSNAGTMRASNGGILQLNGNSGGNFTNVGGTITALNGSEVHLTNGVSITGGTLSTAGTGVIRNLNSASLNSLTNSGTFVANDGTTTTVSGTITNNGTMLFDSTGSLTDLTLAGDVTLAGTGTLTLANADRVGGAGIPTLTNQITIQGETSAGSFGNDQIAITNDVTGVIDANVSGKTLNIDPISGATQFGNLGTLRASNGGILLLNGNNGGDFFNSGTIEAVNGGVLQFTGHVTSAGTLNIGNNTLTISGGNGTYLHSAGSFILSGGTVTSASTISFQGGLIDARGTINANMISAATLQPALGGSGLTVNGNLKLLNASNLSFQLGGLTQGTQYSFLNVNGTVALSGKLVLSFANGFQNSVTGVDTFTITTASGGLSGVFSNIASGARLGTTDGFGSFQVDYAGTNILLSKFLAGPIATSATWITSGGNWNVPANWNINPNYPNNGQPSASDAYDATLANGGSINLNVPIAIEKFTFTNGTLSGANTLTLNKSFSWGGGTLDSGVTVNANGGIDISGQVTLSASTLNNASGKNASMTAAGAQLSMIKNSVFNNNGTFLAQNDQGILISGSFGGGVFHNAGTFTRDTGSGTFFVEAVFDNTGTVNAQTGTLSLNGNDTGSTTGAFNVSSGARLAFNGVFNFAAGSSLAGAGTVDFINGTQGVVGTFTVPDLIIESAQTTFNIPISISTFQLLSGGTLNSAKAVDISGLFTWNSGTITGGGVVNANGGILFNASSTFLNGSTVNNAVAQTATMNNAGAAMTFLNGGIFNNNGTFLAQNDNAFSNGGGTGNTFNNAGTFTRDTSAGTFLINNINFNNTGTLNVNTGTLRMLATDGGSTTGDFNVAAGAVLQFENDFTFTASSDLAGAGTINFNGGTQTIGGTYTVPDLNINGSTVISNIPLNISAFNLINGTFNSAMTVTASGLFTWGATLTGGGVTNANGGILFVGSGLLNGSTLNNAAPQTATLSDPGAGMTMLNGAIFNNNGTFLAQNNNAISNGGGSVNAFNNTGTFTRDTGAGTFLINNNINFGNTGTLNINSGTLQFNGTVTSSGPINVNGATLNLAATFTQTGDAIHLSSGTLTLGGTATAHLIAGTSGTINGSGSLTVANGLNFQGTNGTVVLPPTNGGSLTIMLPTVSFGAAATDINGANFNGGDADATTNNPGGNGGTLDVTATSGDLSVASDLNASTGLNGNVPNGGGTGGTINLTAPQGQINVSRKLQVSDNTGARVSAAGGNINLTSGKAGAGAVAINVASSGQLLSLLNAAAPGPGGKITILATGSGSTINVQGKTGLQTMAANGPGGTIDIRQTNGGSIALGDISGSTPATLRADTIKVAALGPNGQLTIGAGQIDANTMLQLYAPDASGKITFIANVTLMGNSAKYIVAGTVRINDGIQVQILGPAAKVYTNNAQYSVSNGGLGTTSGIFTGSGASTQPLGGPPPPPGL